MVSLTFAEIWDKETWCTTPGISNGFVSSFVVRTRRCAQVLHLGSVLDFHLHRGQWGAGDYEEEVYAGPDEDFTVGSDWQVSADVLQRQHFDQDDLGDSEHDAYDVYNDDDDDNEDNYSAPNTQMETQI